MYDIDVPGQEVETGKKKKKQPSKSKKKKKRESKKPKSSFDKYSDIIEDIKKEKKAVILDKNDEIIEEVPIRDLADELGSLEGKAKKIVFNGIITQRLVDIAKEIDVELLLAKKVGNVPKLPTSLEVISWDDLKS